MIFIVLCVLCPKVRHFLDRPCMSQHSFLCLVALLCTLLSVGNKAAIIGKQHELVEECIMECFS